MKAKYYPIPSKAQRELRRYEGRWLPPFSAGTLLGLTLFFLFIGSAIRSILTPPDMAGRSASFKERMEERAFCRSFQINFLPTTPWKPLCSSLLFKHKKKSIDETINGENSPVSTTRKRKKYLFMQPYGGLGSRLRATASAMALAAEVGAEPVIVWRNSEHGYTGAWDDLFRAPELPFGCFPGEALRPETATCTVHTVNSRSDWLGIKNKWETMTITTGKSLNNTNMATSSEKNPEEIDVLCLKSVMYLTEKQRELKRFYQLLQPAETIQHQVDTFMSAVQWNDSATTWVGVHSRRTDLKLRCTSENCKEGVDVQEALPLSEFTRLMSQVAVLAPESTRIRFYLATDDPEAEEEMKRQLNDMANSAVGGSGGGNDYRIINTSDSPVIVNSGDINTTSSLVPPLTDHQQSVAALDAMVENRYSSKNSYLPIVVSMPKATRDASKGSSQGWLETRSVVSGLQEAVADLFMLSRAQILVGTVGSTFSQTAKLMGNAFFVTAGAHLELKN